MVVSGKVMMFAYNAATKQGFIKALSLNAFPLPHIAFPLSHIAFMLSLNAIPLSPIAVAFIASAFINEVFMLNSGEIRFFSVVTNTTWFIQQRIIRRLRL